MLIRAIIFLYLKMIQEALNYIIEYNYLFLKVRTILKTHGDKELATVTLDSVIMGMKELPLMFYPCSSLDPKVGIRFRGMSIEEMQKVSLNSPCLLLVLADVNTDTRWVVTAYP